jgi:hypothetical protein
MDGVVQAMSARQALTDTFSQKGDPSSLGDEVHIRVFTGRYQQRRGQQVYLGRRN